MTWLILKVLITAVLIVAISEVGKHNALMGALLASIPIVSYLGMLWMHYEKVPVERIAAHAEGVFWLVLPSIPFFAMLPWLLRKGVGFYLSLALATLVMVLLYGIMMFTLRKLGIHL